MSGAGCGKVEDCRQSMGKRKWSGDNGISSESNKGWI